MLTSKVPPPRSKTSTVSCSFLSRPYARAAAVGSLMMRSTSSPAIRPAVLGRRALGVVEVRGYGDHGLRDPLSHRLPGVVGELAQHQRADLLRRVQLAPDVEPRLAVLARHDVVRHRPGLGRDLVVVLTDEALGRVDGALGVEDRLAAGQLPDEPFAGVGEGDDGGGGAGALGVGEDRRFTALPRGDHRIGGAQVDTDCLRHEVLLTRTAAFVRCPRPSQRGGRTGPLPAPGRSKSVASLVLSAQASRASGPDIRTGCTSAVPR